MYQNRNMIHNGFATASEIDCKDANGNYKKMHCIGDQFKLPPYACNTFDMVRILREELESEHTRQNLYKWIDLMYGID